MKGNGDNVGYYDLLWYHNSFHTASVARSIVYGHMVMLNRIVRGVRTTWRSSSIIPIRLSNVGNKTGVTNVAKKIGVAEGYSSLSYSFYL